MKLVRAKIQGFRSISENILDLHVEPLVTVILGPNDHGKTNILLALKHLNESEDFSLDDLNYDLEERHEAFPFVEWNFELESNELELLAEKQNAKNQATHLALLETVDPAGVPTPKGIKPEKINPCVNIARRGVGGKITIGSHPEIDADVLKEVVDANAPHVELIKAQDSLPDRVTASQLSEDAFSFMRGIFYYAGLDPDNSADLFIQNSRTQRRLEDATKVLNEAIKKSWSQGEKLSFRLRHDSKIASIELLIEDPAVALKFVSASKRSSGFTHFFAVKTILHAREQDYNAKSYIFLFDEPGVYLHPSGQYDFMQVLETLGRSNQILYVTHSIFMINKTFPCRHRLVVKGENGTILEGKPYHGRWARALSTLGVSLSGTLLFAKYVLITEGDSEPVYLQSMFQKVIAHHKLPYDLNPLAIMAGSSAQTTEVLIRILLESEPKPQIALLFDGDKGGKDRLSYLSKVIKEQSIPVKELEADCSIEDYLPDTENLFVEAVARFACKLSDPKKLTEEIKASIHKKIQESYGRKFDSGKVTAGVSDWACETIKSILKLESHPSKLGIAREYVNLLAESEVKAESLRRAKSLTEWLAKSFTLPSQVVDESKVLKDPSHTEQ